jgi:transcriptional regulator with XRE-family HTH domain
MSSFPSYLRELRKARGLSLKQVEAKAGVSNAYLSQLERGLRKPPHPDILRRLAKAYEVPVEDLLVTAGYLENGAEKGITREKIEQAFTHVISDPHFRHGTRLKGVRLGPEAKRFIVEVYEKLTGRKLLNPGESS